MNQTFQVFIEGRHKKDELPQRIKVFCKEQGWQLEEGSVVQKGVSTHQVKLSDRPAVYVEKVFAEVSFRVRGREIKSGSVDSGAKFVVVKIKDWKGYRDSVQPSRFPFTESPRVEIIGVFGDEQECIDDLVKGLEMSGREWWEMYEGGYYLLPGGFFSHSTVNLLGQPVRFILDEGERETLFEVRRV